VENFARASEEIDCMTATYVQAARPAAMLAKSLLEVWLSGDKRLLHLTVEQLSEMQATPGANDESDRIELVKCIAWRMASASDSFTPQRGSAQTGAWLNLLDHLSAAASPTN
jgi:hypothetical protein